MSPYCRIDVRAWKIGTRGSPLAMVQAGWVRDRLAEAFPSQTFELCAIKTLGDRKQSWSLEEIGSKGIFTREIEEALLSEGIDLAVHSLKDLPVELPPGLILGPTPKREDPRDVLVSKDKAPLAKLRKKARVGTGSARRSLQLLVQRPDLEIVSIRGNIQTRVQMVLDGKLDAVVLAGAGLRRLNRQEGITEILEPSVMLPAVGQGALAMEIRAGDDAVMKLVEAIGDAHSEASVQAERAFLGALGGGCRVPIGGTARCKGQELTLWGGVFSPDGSRNVRGSQTGMAKDAAVLGAILAKQLREKGAKGILDEYH